MSGLPPLRNVNANDTDFEHIPEQPPARLASRSRTWTSGSTCRSATPTRWAFRSSTAALSSSPTSQGAGRAMINEALARKFFADRDPIGGRISRGFGIKRRGLHGVGVLKDVKQGGVAEAAGTELYLLTDQMPKSRGLRAAADELRRAFARCRSTRSRQRYRQSGRELDPRCRSSACSRWTTSLTPPSRGRAF